MPMSSMSISTSATWRLPNPLPTFRKEREMANRLKEVDAVVVGMGWTGPIMARELTKAGLTVVGLERGPDRNPAEEFVIPRLRDELRYMLRLELMQNNATD